jgi:serine/threonine protein kinase
MLLDSRTKLDLRLALDLSLHAARLLSTIHDAGWAWKDCKPKNFILSNTETLYGCDFEGACRLDEEHETPWGTPTYMPAEDRRIDSGEWLAYDLFAFGVTLHQLLTGRIAAPGEELRPVGTHRRGIPRQVRAVVDALISSSSDSRPGLTQVAAALADGCKEVTSKGAQAGRQAMGPP